MDIRRHLIGGLLAGAVLAPAMAQADTKWYDKVTVGGYASGNYEFWLNQPSALSSTAVPLRAFDRMPNEFDYAGELTLAYADTASSTSANIDLLYGSLGALINGKGNVPTIGQAYLSQGWGPLTLDLGKFATPVGYETWNLTANANYSRSLTYQLEPFFSTGVKLDYAGPAGFGANLWLDDGNSVDSYNTGLTADNGKGWGVALSYSGIKNLALNAQWYENKAGLYTAGGYFDTNAMGDFNAAYTMSDSLSFAFEYLYDTMLDGSSTAPFSPKIQSLAAYATYNTPVKNLSVSGRYEHAFSPDAFSAGTTAGNTIGWNVPPFGTAVSDLSEDSYTLTVKYGMGPVTDILEYRADATNGYNFPTNSTAGSTQSQVDSSVTVAATYGF
jgi:hypothetical protein